MSSTAFSSGARGGGSGANDSSLPVVVAGAGLSGCMSALLLSQEYVKNGIKQKIIVLEHREDFRLEERMVSNASRQHGRSPHSTHRQLKNRCSPSLCCLCACRQDAEGGRMGNAIKRSINLALSHRGICALQAAGLSDSQHSWAMHRLVRCTAWRSLELSLPVRAALPLPVTSFR